MRTFPVLTGSRTKIAEIQKDGFAECPICGTEWEIETPGLTCCLDCMHVFEAVVPEGPDDEGAL